MASADFTFAVRVPHWRRALAIWALRFAWIVSLLSPSLALLIGSRAVQFVLDGVRIEPA